MPLRSLCLCKEKWQPAQLYMTVVSLDVTPGQGPYLAQGWLVVVATPGANTDVTKQQPGLQCTTAADCPGWLDLKYSAKQNQTIAVQTSWKAYEREGLEVITVEGIDIRSTFELKVNLYYYSICDTRLTSSEIVLCHTNRLASANI